MRQHALLFECVGQPFSEYPGKIELPLCSSWSFIDVVYAALPFHSLHFAFFSQPQ
jgi:hypothetical protein